MRKLLIPLAMMLVSFQLNAQKNIPDAIKAIDKVKAETAHPKKGTNPATWIKLANAYLGYYNIPSAGILPGTNQLQMKLVLKDQQVLSSEQKEINGTVFTADTYSDKVLYYDKDGNLAAWEIKENSIENPLDKAYEALVKANELDSKKAQTKKISEIMTTIASYASNDARNAFYLGDMKNSSLFFEKSSEILANPIIGQVDSMSIYNAAYTSLMNKDYARATKFFEKCAEINYIKDGDVYASLAECYKADSDTAKAKEILEVGFQKYPTSQGILVSLINTYLDSKDDPSKVLAYIKTAQKNEPTNSSLYLAEGNTYLKLDSLDSAIACYKKSTEINPDYAIGYFYEGKTYYDKALKIQDVATNEPDDAKYNELIAQLEKTLETSLEPFEKAFNTSKEDDLKAVAAEYLRNIYYRFRDKGENYKASYEKYNTFLGK